MTLPGFTTATQYSFTGTHAGLGGLFGNGLVGEDLDPDLTAALDITGHCDTRRLDLVAGDPCGFHGDETVFTVSNGVAAVCGALHAAAEHSAALDSLRH